MVDLGMLAYLAYGEYVGMVNFQGDPMPEWDDLPERIQRAWREAARRVEFTVRGRTVESCEDGICQGE